MDLVFCNILPGHGCTRARLCVRHAMRVMHREAAAGLLMNVLKPTKLKRKPQLVAHQFVLGCAPQSVMNATTLSSYWSERCSAAVNPPLPALLSRLAASSFSGIVFFAASAFLSFLILLVWLRAAANDRAKLWDHLSAFAGLTFAGSCIGIVMFYAFFSFESRDMSLFGDASLSAPSKGQLLADNEYWQATYNVSHALEFWFQVFAKLLVLRRVTMTTAATSMQLRPHSEAIRKFCTWFTAAVLAINTAGLVCAVVSAYWLVLCGHAYIDGRAGDAIIFYDNSSSYVSIQSILEVISLLLIIAACLCISPFVARLLRIIVSSASNSSRAVVAGKRLRLRLFLTFMALVLTFILRAVRSLIVAHGTFAPIPLPLLHL